MATRVSGIGVAPYKHDGKLILGLIYSLGVAGLILRIGYFLLAVLVGYFKITEWLKTQIEVDAAPPGSFCTIKIYSSLSGLQGLRHGLYLSNDVVDDIIQIIKKIKIDPSHPAV